MSTSAFGVEYGEAVVFNKAAGSPDKERAKHYGRMATTTGALGGLTGAVGAGSAIVGEAESRGHDPMGFVKPMTPGGRKTTPALRARLLRGTALAHGRQAAAMGGIGGASLGIAGAYKHKQTKELAKAMSSKTKRKAGDAALGTAATGIGVGAAGAGVHYGRHMGQDFTQAAKNVMQAKKNVKIDPSSAKFYRHFARGEKVVLGVKGPAIAAGLGAGALGLTGAGELARYHHQTKKAVMKSAGALSAFGVDHGHEEFAKAAGQTGVLTRLGTKIGEKTMKTGIKVQDKGAAMAAKAKKTGPSSLFGQGAVGALGEGHLQTGGALHRYGTAMAANPGLTGKLAVGGAGTAGAGGLGYAARKRS